MPSHETPPIRNAVERYLAASDESFIERATSIADLDDVSERPILVIFDATGQEQVEELPADDPVVSLYTRHVPDDALAVGLVADATVNNPSWQHPEEFASVVHLVDRDGRSTTVLATGAPRPSVFGPDREPQVGRVPDACRRMLGLPTAPPDGPMTHFVLASWLELVVQHATARPGMDWGAVINLHPAIEFEDAYGSLNPAEIARRTHVLGERLDWNKFRVVVSAGCGFPFGPDATEIAWWMDAGMFSRWAMDEIPDREVTLEILDAVLQPSTFDRVWATIRMCDEK
jgi:hypothetical protein